ncbi:ECs_2282 family putative zinc-binding protein [Candidatus Pantoea multigeneris]|nr:hypothetical protein [Pantoea multigeneris]
MKIRCRECGSKKFTFTSLEGKGIHDHGAKCARCGKALNAQDLLPQTDRHPLKESLWQQWDLER